MMDSRVAERRKGVSEDRARRRLTWVLSVLGIVLLAGAGIWLIRSPLLSISHVEITGASVSDPGAVLADLDMGSGRPTIDIDGGAIEARLLEDPWVKSADVSVVWPQTLVVDVVEFTPVAPVQSGDRWVLASIEGAVLADAGVPDTQTALVAIDVDTVEPGDVIDDAAVIGALEFIDASAGDLRVGMRLRVESGTVVADVEGHRIILGRPVEMAMKAVVLDGLLSSGIQSGAEVNLVAPTRPAIANPEPQPEVEE